MCKVISDKPASSLDEFFAGAKDITPLAIAAGIMAAQLSKRAATATAATAKQRYQPGGGEFSSTARSTR